MEYFWQQALLFIDRWSYVFYGVGLLGVLLYVLRAREAFRQRRYTPFPIEREEATAMLRDSVIILVILVAILGTTAYIDLVLLAVPKEVDAGSIALISPSPTLTSPAIGPSPTVAVSVVAEEAPGESEITTAGTGGGGGVVKNVVAEPTSEPEPTGESEVAEPTPLPTDTPVPTPTMEATAIPTQPPPPTETPPPPPTSPPPPTNTPAPAVNVPAANCPTAGVQITSPHNAQRVSGNITIAGTANIDRFQFYKVEYAANGTSGPYVSIGDIVREPVTNGTLMTWNTGGFGSGVWNLRLTVVDETGNFPAPCDIYVVIP